MPSYTGPRRVRPTAGDGVRNQQKATPGMAGGRSKSLRPVPGGAANRQSADAGQSGVIVGRTSAADTAGTTGVAITATIDDPAAGPDAAVAGSRALALADNSIADGVASVAAGASAEAHQDQDTSVGCQAYTAGPGATSVGFDAHSFGSNNTSVGAGAQTGTSGSPITGATAVGTGATATADNELALGNGSAIAIIRGKLVIADASAGLWQIVVSTGGALSTVAYP